MCISYSKKTGIICLLEQSKYLLNDTWEMDLSFDNKAKHVRTNFFNWMSLLPSIRCGNYLCFFEQFVSKLV